MQRKIVVLPTIKVSAEFREIPETNIFSSSHHIICFQNSRNSDRSAVFYVPLVYNIEKSVGKGA